MDNKRIFYGEIYNSEKSVIEKKTKNNKYLFGIIPNDVYKYIKDDKQVVAYVKQINKACTNKKYGTLFLSRNNKTYGFDVYKSRPVFCKTQGFIKVNDNEYIGVVKDYLILVLLLCLFVLCFIGLLMFSLINKPIEVVNNEPIIIEDINDDDLSGQLILPEGLLIVEGKIKDLDEQLYSGLLKIKIVLNVDNDEHVILESEVEVIEGKIPNLYLDFTKLDYELVPGVYYGTIYLTYPSGLIQELPFTLVVRQSTGGTIELNYSDEIEVDLNSNQIKLNYSQGPGSNKTKIQIILLENEEEIILAESLEIDSGEQLKNLTLDKNIKGKLRIGEYKGLIRVIPLSLDNGIANIHSDIEVSIKVN